MVIKRQIDGKSVDIELSPSELRYAYYEQEHKYDMEDVENRFDDIDDKDFAEHGITREYAEAHIGEIAHNKRRNMTEYGMSWKYALDEAINSFLEECEANT